MGIVLVCFLIIAVGVITGVFLNFRKKVKQRDLEIGQLDEKVIKLEKELIERDHLTAYTTHEIRTPLSAISGGITLLSKTDLNPKQTKYVETIKSSVDNTLLIVNDVLNLAKLEAGAYKKKSKNFLFSEVLNGIMHVFRFKAEEKGITLDITIDEKIPAILKGDISHLNQILLNLVSNAVKFTDLGGVIIDVELTEKNGSKCVVLFKVTDTGKGIRKGNLPNVFKRYEQEESHVIKTSGGTGLGLSITKKLVELNDGEIGVDSKFMEGSTFWFELPFEIGQQKKSAPETKSLLEKNAIKGMRILVVDDNQLNREILIDLFNHYEKDILFTEASNGVQAIDFLTKKEFDFVLMDIQMPQLDGYATSKKIRDELGLKNLPIIAMTAHDLTDEAEKCFKAGMNDYISKPVDLDHLLNKMARFLPRKKYNYRKNGVINLQHLIDLSKDNKAKMLKYIDIFLKNVPKDLIWLKNSVEKKDYKEIRNAAHKLKGNVSYMGIRHLESIFTLSELSKIENLSEDQIQQFSKEIISVCNQAKEELEEIKENFKKQ